jgi:hypothetical protein
MKFNISHMIFLAAVSAFAQNPLPLQIGNAWQYRSTDPFEPYPFRTDVTRDTVLPNSHHYFVLNGSTFGSPFLRLDSSKVLAFSVTQSLEYKLFDFRALPGDTMAVLNGGTDIIVFRSTWIDTIVHKRYWNFAAYRGSPPVMYVFVSWILRDSIGLVSLTGEPGITWYMTGARIAGDTIGVLTSVKQNELNLPEQPLLKQNYPNPFNPTTTIEFVVPKKQYVIVDILNLLGQSVERIFSDEAQSGATRIQWNALKQASGVYYVRMQTAEFAQTRKLILLR